MTRYSRNAFNVIKSMHAVCDSAHSTKWFAVILMRFVATKTNAPTFNTIESILGISVVKRFRLTSYLKVGLAEAYSLRAIFACPILLKSF